MNNILNHFLEDHIKAYELKCDTSRAFEHFFNYLTVRNYTSRHFDPADVSLGKGEVGIDGVAIIVNDTLVTSFIQIEEFFNNNMDISVSLVFVQSKTSESFESSELSQFFAAVNDFMNSGRIFMNEKAEELRKIYQYIVDNPTKLAKNPDCYLFYSFTGLSSNDSVRNALVEQQIELMKKSSLFDEIAFNLYDSNKIIVSYRAIKNSIKKSVEMIDCAVIPKINGIDEAYIGVVRCKDFVKLISNDDGAIISNLFEDNVRYFQGHNNINAEIQGTLRDKKKQEKFSVLNNGVTIVAKSMRRTGNNITLSGFQVINGCQTSFILYENRMNLSDNSYIVIKLISTEDKNLTDSIVKTTNRQTPVLNEAFETLRDFHKNLEEVYLSYDIKDRLYYERRSKQYDSEEVNKTRIISFPLQTASYVAVFLSEPHSTHRYYGELLKSYSKRIYNENHVLEQYCMASMYVYTVDNYLKHNADLNKYKKFKFHIALILRLLANNQKLPDPSNKKMKAYCDELYKKISDFSWVSDSISKACYIIEEIIKCEQIVPKDGNDITRTKEFTNQILNKVGSGLDFSPQLPILKKGSKVKCKVQSWNNSFVYVELIDYKEHGSIHVRHINGRYISNIGDVLKESQILEATVLEDEPDSAFGYALTLL